MKLIVITAVSIFLLSSCNSRSAKKPQNSIDKSAAIPSINRDTKTEKKEILCKCFLLDSGKIKLYDTIKGRIIDTIQNDYEMENFYSISVYLQVNDWFNIKAEAIENETSGWILNKAYLATYSKNYIDTLFVYSKPDTTSSAVCFFPEYFTIPMKVIECQKD